MAKAIIWCRVSTTEQELESQKKDLIKHAAEDGFSTDNQIIIGKEGASAIKMNEVYQEEVNKLIDTIERDLEVSTIYVWEVSRLARNEEAFYKMKNKLIKSHIQLICQVPQLTLLNNNGEVNTGAEITLNLLVTLAKQEMEIKAKRFARGKKRLAEAGKYNGGNIPFGYMKDPKRENLIVIHEDEAKLIREIFNMYENGITQSKIVKELNNRGISMLTISSINNILNNERYTGREHCYQGSSYKRSYPIIVTQEQFHRCRKIANTNNTNADKTKNIYYANHLITCKQCGRFFSASGSKVDYHCYDAYNQMRKYNNNKTPQCCNKISISINIVDSLVWKLAQEAELNYVVNTAATDRSFYKNKLIEINQKLNAIPIRINALNKKIERIAESYIDMTISKEVRDKKMTATNAEKRGILTEEAAHIKEKEHHEELLNGIESMCCLDDVDNIADHLRKIIVLKEKIANITNDLERSNIVHRHIQKITVENSKLEYEFGVGKHTAKARFLTIWFYNGNIKYFYYLPSTGKGGVIIKSDADRNALEKISFEYLGRYYDETKRRLRQDVREKKREERTTKYPEEKYVLSYSRLAKFLHVTISTAYRWVETKQVLKPAVVGYYNKEIVVDKSKCLELIKSEAKHNNWARKILFKINNIKE